MDAVEDIKSRLSIEDVIGEYLELKRSGRNLRALSPFTSEKTPSFMVSPEKQIWHDFSSSKGGNMFSFVMDMEGVDFKGALQILARKAGIDLDQYQTSSSASQGQLKERLFSCLEYATKFYQVQFSKNQTALEYILKKRHFTKQTALKFRIGYAPNNGRALVQFLEKKGYSDKEIKQAGLATTRYQLANDMFRARIMIPLSDSQGRVVGFTARLLGDQPDTPKYINTPQTLLYDKSRHVYGLDLAKEAIRKNNFVVVVEGNLDVIASHQAGINNVVATAGTALTTQHLKELNRFTADIRLAFDQDSAGLMAVERAIPLANQIGVSLSIITIPSGKDPDELVRKDPKAWQEVITKPNYALDWLIDHLTGRHDISSAQGKRQFSDEILPVIHQLKDSVEQEHYIGVIADKLQVSKSALEQKLSLKNQSTIRKRKIKVQPIDPGDIDLLKNQNHLMSLLLMQPPLREKVPLVNEQLLITEDAKSLMLYILKHPHDNPNQVIKKLPDIRDYVKILVLLYEEIYQNLEFNELQDEATRLQVRLVETYVKSQKNTLVSQLIETDEKQTGQLLIKVKELDTLLRIAKESVSGK